MSVREDKVQVNVEINGQKAGATMKELETSAKQLRRELKQLPTDTEQFTAKAAELRGVNNQLKAISDSIKGVDKNLEDAGKSSNVFTRALTAGLGFFTGGAIVDGLKSLVGNTRELFNDVISDARDAQRSTNQLVQSLGGNVEAATQLADQADKIEKSLNGLFSAEDVQDAQARLAIYTKEAGAIEQLTPRILDLAAAKGVDLATAADAVGRTLEGNGDALKKLGISVKDAATEEQRLALITEGLTEKVGGQAEVVAASTKTGWDGLKITLGDIAEKVAFAVLPIINKLGDFLNELVKRSQPVIDIFSNVIGVFGQVWGQIKQLLASFGLFNDKVSLSERLIQGLTTAFGFVGKVMTAVWGAVRDVIGAFNELVAKGAGVVSAVITSFTSLKTFFTDIFSSVGQILKGVFTLDITEITAGVASLKGSFGQIGADVRSAYESGYKTVKDRQKAVADKDDEEDTKKEVEKAADRGKKVAKAEGDAKAAEKARKQKEERDKNLADLQAQVDDVLIGAQRDGKQKDVNQENLRYEREQTAFVKRVNELRKNGADEKKIREEYYAFDEASLAVHMDNLADINQKHEDKRKADAQKSTEQLKKEKEDYYKNEVDSVNLYYDTLINAIRENEAKKASVAGTQEEIDAIKQKAADAELAIEIQKNTDLQKINQENGKSTLEQEKFLSDERLKKAEKHAQGRRLLEEQVKGTVKDGLDFAIDALSQDEKARKKNAGLIKAFSVAKVFINLQEEISGIFSNANKNALNAFIPGSGNVLGAVQAALAVGRATFAVSKINNTQFWTGGHTGKGLGYADSSGHQVAGVVHANEWVSPEWMTSHPTYGKVIHQLEDVRMRGFATGGFTTTPTGGLPNFSSTISESTMIRFVNAMENFPAEVKAKVVYSDFENVKKDVDDVRRNANIG